MGDIIVDASVIAKWYIPEQDHEQARALRDDYLNGRHKLLAPALLPFEVINALKYSGQYEGDRLIEASTTLSKYGIELIQYGGAGPIAEVAVDLDVTLYDASYLALGLKKEATVYTADSHLIEATQGSEHSSRLSHIRHY